MNPEDAEEWTQALGQSLGGNWRMIALGRRMGVPQALGISTEEWVNRRLGGYVSMSINDRREANKELADGGLSTREAAEVLGVSQTTVVTDLKAEQNRSAEADRQSHQEELVEQNRSAEKEAAAQETRNQREASRSASILPDAMDYRVGDARVVLADIQDSSVNLVLTDPPYGDEAELLYEWLAEFSARVLIPGGSLICYTGQSRLNRDVAIFDRHLRYWWLLTMKHDQAQRLPGKFVIAESKPVLWYVKERRRGRTLVNDMISSKRDHSAHPWSQGSGGVALLIENLTDPGEKIVDPFAGTGKWGEVAVRMGRRWIGSDIVKAGAAEVVA